MSPVSTFDLVSVADLETSAVHLDPNRNRTVEFLQDFIDMTRENRKAQLAHIQETSRRYLTSTNVTG